MSGEKWGNLAMIGRAMQGAACEHQKLRRVPNDSRPHAPHGMSSGKRAHTRGEEGERDLSRNNRKICRAQGARG